MTLVTRHCALRGLVDLYFECRTWLLRKSETPARFFAAA